MHTRPLTPADLNAVERLAPHLLAHVGWCLHTGYATVLGLLLGEVVVGVATALRFAPHAQVGPLYFLPSLRTSDAPLELLGALLHALHAHGCTTVVAHATPDEQHLWTPHGFAAYEEWVRYSGGTFVEAVHPEVVALEPAHYLSVLHLDRRATGMHRAPLLLEHEYLGKVYVRAGRVAGFALPLLGNGLVVATDAEAGLELQRWLWPVKEHLVLPATNSAAHAHLTARTHSTTTALVRLVHGPPPPAEPVLVYGW